MIKIVIPTMSHTILLCFLKLINLFIYFWLGCVFLAARGLFSSCSKQGLHHAAVHRLLIAVASLVVEHRL